MNIEAIRLHAQNKGDRKLLKLIEGAGNLEKELTRIENGAYDNATDTIWVSDHETLCEAIYSLMDENGMSVTGLRIYNEEGSTCPTQKGNDNE